MKYLLDTHVWLWIELAPSRLRDAVTRALRQEDAELWLSPLSLWEAGVLERKGRFALDRGVDGYVARTLSAGNIQIAPVNAAVVLEVGRLPFRHFDPADNLIAATARVHGLTLVTADRRLLALPGLDCLPA